jgi:hypothetical protein
MTRRNVGVEFFRVKTANPPRHARRRHRSFRDDGCAVDFAMSTVGSAWRWPGVSLQMISWQWFRMLHLA